MSTVQTPAPPARSLSSYLAVGAVILASIVAVLALAWAVTGEDESTSVVQGSGTAVAETRGLPPFSGVELVGVNQVTIGVGGEQLVVVRADDNLVNLITTSVQDGVLVVDQTGSVDPVTPLTVEVTVPALETVRLSGTGAIVLDGHDLDALDVSLPGAGSIRAAGTVGRLAVVVEGTGEADLSELVTRDATVAVPGTGAVFVNVTGTLDVDVSGTGSVVYSGGPDRVDEQITGTGSVTQG